MDISEVLTRMETISGWFSSAEATLLFRFTERALQNVASGALVEIGSYCGRSTIVLGAAAQNYTPLGKVFAIDPHEGMLSGPSGRYFEAPSLASFQANIQATGLEKVVVVVKKASADVVWSGPIGLLFIDGLHDYRSVAQDFAHFEPWIQVGGYAAFHDCPNPDYPDVEKYESEVIRSGRFSEAGQAESLKVLRKER